MPLTRRVMDDVIRAENPDIVQANSPVLNAIPALRAAARHDLPVVYEIRAFWEDAAVTAGSTSEGSLRYKLTRAMEFYAVKHADAITTICNGLRKDIVDRGVPDSKVTLIPNTVDIENFQADIRRDEALAQSLDLNGKSVLGFLGSFYAYERLDLVVRVLPGILQGNPDTVLLLVAGAPMEESLKAIAETVGGDCAETTLPGLRRRWTS